MDTRNGSGPLANPADFVEPGSDRELERLRAACYSLCEVNRIYYDRNVRLANRLAEIDRILSDAGYELDRSVLKKRVQ